MQGQRRRSSRPELGEKRGALPADAPSTLGGDAKRPCGEGREAAAAFDSGPLSAAALAVAAASPPQWDADGGAERGGRSFPASSFMIPAEETEDSGDARPLPPGKRARTHDE